jgi:hypothetical protein
MTAHIFAAPGNSGLRNGDIIVPVDQNEGRVSWIALMNGRQRRHRGAS